MKVVILAGGFGTRLSEETDRLPKALVEIGGKPIIWHLMSLYAAQGFNEFVLALGYKQELIKDYFLNFHARDSDMTVDLATGGVTPHGQRAPNWRVHLVDTGASTQTGGRLKRLLPWLGDEPFMMTYTDGLANVDLRGLVAYHRSHQKLVTVTAVHPRARFGELELDGGAVRAFVEKPQTGLGWINGGFFVIDPRALAEVDGDAVPWELEPMERLSTKGELMAFQHEGFWQPMDTLREKRLLDSLWEKGEAPWKLW